MLRVLLTGDPAPQEPLPRALGTLGTLSTKGGGCCPVVD